MAKIASQLFTENTSIHTVLLCCQCCTKLGLVCTSAIWQIPLKPQFLYLAFSLILLISLHLKPSVHFKTLLALIRQTGLGLKDKCLQCLHECSLFNYSITSYEINYYLAIYWVSYIILNTGLYWARQFLMKHTHTVYNTKDSFCFSRE